MPPATTAAILLTLHLLGSDQIQDLLASLADMRAPEKRDAFEETGELVERAIRNDTTTWPNAPRTPEWRGNLKASLDHEIIVEGDEMAAVVFTDQEYAAVQERGYMPYMPNIDNLREWARDHGYTAWYVARAIAARGIPALNYMQQGLIDSEDEIVQKIGHAYAQILEKRY